jgi:hypothetical protein
MIVEVVVLARRRIRKPNAKKRPVVASPATPVDPPADAGVEAPPKA